MKEMNLKSLVIQLKVSLLIKLKKLIYKMGLKKVRSNLFRVKFIRETQPKFKKKTKPNHSYFLLTSPLIEKIVQITEKAIKPRKYQTFKLCLRIIEYSIIPTSKEIPIKLNKF